MRTAVPVLGDLLVFTISLGAVVLLREPIRFRLYMFAAFGPVFSFWLAVLYGLGLYEMRVVRDFVSLVGNLLVSAALCAATGIAYFYFVEPYTALTPKTILLATVLLAHVLLLGWRRLLLYVLDYQLINQRLVFLGDDDAVRELEASMRECREETGFQAVRWGPEGADIMVADARWVEEHWDQAKDMIGTAIRNKVPVVSWDNFYEAISGRVSPEYVGNPGWSLEFVLPKRQGLYPKIKRLLDMLIAGAALAVLAPLLVLVYAAVKLADGGPPIYGQPRVGALGKEFVLWKFRTMAVDADAAGPFASGPDHDARVTRLGRWLRRFRLDELPQLWNVFRGEMSLVGPRPEWVKEVEVLEQLVPSYHLRHLLTPGITGWAQVYYRATKNPKDSIEKHHYDLYYLKYFSFALDCAILLKTLKRIFIKDSLLPVSNALRPRFYGLAGRKLADLSAVIVRN